MNMTMRTQLTILAATLLLALASTTPLLAQYQPDPDPDRFDEQIEQFIQYDAQNSFPEDAILFTGSSSIRIWKTADAFPGYPIINRGFGGSHISDVLYFFDDVIGTYDPRLVIFYAGDNDVASGKSAEQVLADYQFLTTRVLALNDRVEMLFIPIKPSGSRWHLWDEMSRANEMVRSLSDRNPRLHYVDFATPMLGPDGTPDERFLQEDRLHLTEEGYEVWNGVLAPELKQLYPR
ncbi:MAG: GDSL-type esterase/lipase family protein [Bacteroidota bacterium]